jgi:hypothetical protein
MLSTRIIQLTVPSSDDGEEFIRTDRLDLIRQALANSEYSCFADLPLAKVYRHQAFESGNPVILVSCHIDSVYSEYYAITKDGELLGTFDNSACNAVAVESMLNGLFPPQILISFTGDEESDSRGADQTIESLQIGGIFDKLEMVITLDLTEEHYQSCHFTIENYFVEKENGTSLLKFGRKRQLKEYLSGMIESPAFIKDAEADESWQYDEYDLNCFSLCLPCRLLGDDMHDDVGVAITSDSIFGYMNALGQFVQAINKDLAGKVIHQK